MSVDANIRNDMLSALENRLEDEFVFPDVGKKLADMLRERQGRKEFDSITSAETLASVVTRQMAEIAHDGHLRVNFTADGLKSSEQDVQAIMRYANAGVEDVGRLRGNIGYLNLQAFRDQAPFKDAMEILANTDALIIDLRENRGGSASAVQLLASYLFAGTVPVHLNDIAYRKPGTKDYDLIQSWTKPDVPGRRYTDREVYVLTSPFTFSAAEEFTYDLKVLRRATIVGERTGGGAHDNKFEPLTKNFVVSMPNGNAINPITKTNWERTGIEPDLEVPQQEALKTAHIIAIEHLIAHETNAKRASALEKVLESVKAHPECPCNSVRNLPRLGPERDAML